MNDSPRNSTPFVPHVFVASSEATDAVVVVQLKQVHCTLKTATVYTVLFLDFARPPATHPNASTILPKRSNVLTGDSSPISRTHTPRRPHTSHKSHKHSIPVTEPYGLPSQSPHSLAAAQHYRPQRRPQNSVQQQQVYCSAAQRAHDLVLVFRIRCSPVFYCSRVRRSNTSLSGRHGRMRLLQNLEWLHSRIQDIWL